MARIFFVRPAHRKLALFEKCIHNGLRDKGFFTPRVWVAEDASPELGSVVVMDLVPGAPLMAACSWRVPVCWLVGGYRAGHCANVHRASVDPQRAFRRVRHYSGWCAPCG